MPRINCDAASPSDTIDLRLRNSWRGVVSMIKVVGNVDENRRLSAQLPASIRPGPVMVLILPASEEDGDAG